MKTRTILTVLVACLTAAAPLAADPPSPEGAGAASKPATPPPKGLLRMKHLRLDLAKRQIHLDAQVCNREAFLEFLLCYQGTKEHESILTTKAKPSTLHAALLALGLTPGKYARWIPTEAGRPPHVIPPRGAGLRVEFRWTDADGKAHKVAASDWLKTTGRGSTQTVPKTWVFVGSDVLDNHQYLADIDGQIISVANFAESVIDVPFDSSASMDLEDSADAGELTFRAKTEAIPPLGTAVEIVITPVPGAEKAEHARVNLEINRFGNLRIDGQDIPFKKLRAWAEKYTDRHAKGQVVIRSRPRAIAHDVTRVRDELRIGGVFDIEEVRLPLYEPLLPRTPPQAADALAEWADKFANPRDYIREPSQGAAEMLDQIDRSLQELEARKQLLREYRMHIEAGLEKYKPTTRPADTPAPPAPPGT